MRMFVSFALFCMLAFGAAVNAQTSLEIRVAEARPAPGLAEAPVSLSGQHVYVERMPVITNADVTGARVVPFGSRFNIEVSFTPDGARRMAAATAAHIGKPLAIMIDGRVISAPVVDATIDQGALLTGDWTRTEADELVARLTGR